MASDDRQIRFLDAMGVQAWGRRQTTATEHEPVIRFDASPPDMRASVPVADAVDSHAGLVSAEESPAPMLLDWAALTARVAACRQCVLHKGRTQTVFGTGNRQAQWFIVGEAPGADEDAQGEPFVGRAGQLLNAMIRAVGAKREQLYIANIVKCRPPSNRNPRTDEAACCAPYLQRQIELVKPRLVLAVGRVAANNLLGNEKTLGSMRGQVYEYSADRIPLVVTYHPAYLLRKPSEKAKTWQDLKLAMSVAPALTN